MRLFRRLAYWLRIGRHDADLREEIEAHRALVQAKLESEGLTHVAAAAESRRVMGNMTLAREEARDVWVVALSDRIRHDIRHGARALAREPGFAIVAVLTLALGVAITTTVFSVVDAELWKPLPYPEPERLVAIRSMGAGGPRASRPISGADLMEWRAQSRTFENLAGVGQTRRGVLRRDTPESVRLTFVTSSYFETLGREAMVGRTFHSREDSHASVAVLVDTAWERLFNRDPAAIGRTVTLDGEAVAIVGVVRADHALGSDPDLYVAIRESASGFRDRAVRTLNAIGRVGPGVPLATAQAELQAIAAHMAAGDASRAGETVEIADLREYFTGNNWRPLYFFLGASLVVLALSCVNVANLLLARALRRSHEFAIRGALGGGRRAIARQLLVEGAMIAVPGGLLGILLTDWALAFFTARLPSDYLARSGAIPIDARVCAFAFAVTAVTAVVFGLAPSLFAQRVNLNEALGHGRTAGGPPAHVRARQILLVGEVALTVVLLAGAGIFLKSFVALTHVPLGFDPDSRLSARVSLSGPRYATDAQVRSYADALLEHARGIPGVREAAIATSSPLGSGPVVNFARRDHPRPARGQEPRAIFRAVGPGYFGTLGIRLLRGREFNADDVSGSDRVAVVNEQLAATLFAGEDPIGRVIELLPGARAPWAQRPGPLTIVGMAANVREVGFNEIAFNDIYVSIAQSPAPGLELVVRTAVPPSSLAALLREAAAKVDADIPVTSVSTFDSRVSGALSGDRFNLLLIWSFAAAAIALAAIGIYGAIAYAMRERQHEFSVRLALGALPRRIVMTAMGQAARLGVIGGVGGIGAALLLARLLGDALYLVAGEHNGLLYGVTTTDPAALAGAFAAILALTLIAAAVPARDVANVDPLVTLRHD